MIVRVTSPLPVLSGAPSDTSEEPEERLFRVQLLLRDDSRQATKSVWLRVIPGSATAGATMRPLLLSTQTQLIAPKVPNGLEPSARLSLHDERLEISAAAWLPHNVSQASRGSFPVRLRVDWAVRVGGAGALGNFDDGTGKPKSLLKGVLESALGADADGSRNTTVDWASMPMGGSLAIRSSLIMSFDSPLAPAPLVPGRSYVFVARLAMFDATGTALMSSQVLLYYFISHLICFLWFTFPATYTNTNTKPSMLYYYIMLF
jgi:hypothetical protein